MDTCSKARSDVARQRQIELFTTIDPNWLDYALMFIASVRKYSTVRVRYTIFCPSTVTSPRLCAWAGDHDVLVRVVGFDETIQRSPAARKMDLRVPVPGISVCAYWGRYCAQYLFDEPPERLIYADVDMYAMSDLAPLMNLALGTAPVGAVRYPNDAVVARTGVPPGQYVNNGLLVFDTRRFDGAACVAGMQRALASGRTVFGPQCAFNVAMQGRIALLDDVWNVQGDLRTQLASTARLIHFTGNTKPWHTLSADPLRWKVRDLLREVGCNRAWRPDRSPAKVMRLAARRLRATWKTA